MQKIRIGCGAGFSGDRFEPAVILAERGELDYLVLECLAERTIALAQKIRKHDPAKGYDPMLERRIRQLLPLLKAKGIRLVTNMGAANPVAGAERICSLARDAGLSLRVAAVTGDDVLSQLTGHEIALETGLPLSQIGTILSANAYLGIDALLPALESKADVIITGRVADPSLFLAPMVHEFGWPLEDWDRLGQGAVIGHLMECAGHLTGGYFADPGKKDVPDLARLGHPFVDVFENGEAVLGKVSGTGGVLNLATAKEQLLYEVGDPGSYLTPDVVADFTGVRLHQLDLDQVQAVGGKGGPRPAQLKVSVGYDAGFVGEGEISYAGTNAIGRAQLAGAVLEERLWSLVDELQIDYIGLTSLHQVSFGHQEAPYEVRLRAAAKASSEAAAALVGEEVEALYTNGPAGGGGARKYVREVVGIVSILMPREKVDSKIRVLES